MINQAGWRSFIKLCLAAKNEKMLSSLFNLFLTSDEKDSLAMRTLLIIELLKKNKTQREISKDLNISIAKITRGSNELKRMPPKLIDFLKKNTLKNVNSSWQ